MDGAAAALQRRRYKLQKTENQDRNIIMQHYQYRTAGICPSLIDFDLDGTTVRNVQFTGGCNGNLKAIGKLVEGMSVDQVHGLLIGNTCGNKPTSCADQLAQALKDAAGRA